MKSQSLEVKELSLQDKKELGGGFVVTFVLAVTAVYLIHHYMHE